MEDIIKSGRPLSLSQKRFYTSSLCADAEKALQALVDSPEYNTNPSRLADSSTSFVERHLHYLSTHPLANLNGYISNLKLMTRVTRSRPAN